MLIYDIKLRQLILYSTTSYHIHVLPLCTSTASTVPCCGTPWTLSLCGLFGPATERLVLMRSLQKISASSYLFYSILMYPYLFFSHRHTDRFVLPKSSTSKEALGSYQRFCESLEKMLNKSTSTVIYSDVP